MILIKLYAPINLIGAQINGVSIMKNSKINFEELLISKNFIKEPQLVTIETLKKISTMKSKERKEHISSFCTEEELHDLMEPSYSLDSTLLVQFALEDFDITIEQLSDKTKIKVKTLKQIIEGKMMPWKLKVEEIAQMIRTLNISVDEYTRGLKNKTIIVDSKDINIEGVQLPRAKNMTKSEQKKAMIDMEKQILLEDEAEERDEFIQTLKSFVNR